MTKTIQKLTIINLILLAIVMIIVTCNILFSTYIIGINYFGSKEIEVNNIDCTPKPICET